MMDPFTCDGDDHACQQERWQLTVALRMFELCPPHHPILQPAGPEALGPLQLQSVDPSRFRTLQQKRASHVALQVASAATLARCRAVAANVTDPYPGCGAVIRKCLIFRDSGRIDCGALRL